MNARGDELVVSRRCAVIISAAAGLCASRIQNPRGDKWPSLTDEMRRKQFAHRGNSPGIPRAALKITSNEREMQTATHSNYDFTRFIL